MAHDLDASSGSVSSGTTRLLSLPDLTYVQNLLNTSVSSRMLFGDGVGEGVEERYVPYVVENEHECSGHSSQHHIDQEAIADHVMRTGSSDYCSVRERTYYRLFRRFLPKSKQVPFLLCFSVTVGLLAFSLVAIFTAQYTKSIKYVYIYENCTLCSDLTEDDRISMTYLRRLGELKYCCFKTSRDPISRLNKAVMKTFASTIEEKQLQRNMSNEINAAMEITLEIGEVSEYFISDDTSLLFPMRKLKPLYGDMKVEEDRLVIQTPGRYFVTSQFYQSMKFVKQEIKRFENVVGHDISIHRAYQDDTEDDDQLMVSFYTPREFFPKTDYHVSHMAGIFRLEENDNIYVGVTQKTSNAYFDFSRNRLSLIFLGE